MASHRNPPFLSLNGPLKGPGKPGPSFVSESSVLSGRGACQHLPERLRARPSLTLERLVDESLELGAVPGDMQGDSLVDRACVHDTTCTTMGRREASPLRPTDALTLLIEVLPTLLAGCPGWSHPGTPGPG
jgi:hypothetical protein